MKQFSLGTLEQRSCSCSLGPYAKTTSSASLQIHWEDGTHTFSGYIINIDLDVFLPMDGRTYISSHPFVAFLITP